MCMLSVVLDYGRQEWPYGIQTWPSSPNTTGIHIPDVPSAEEWTEFLELVEKAKKFDELTNQPHCEDPLKVAWMRDVERRLAALDNEVFGEALNG